MIGYEVDYKLISLFVYNLFLLLNRMLFLIVTLLFGIICGVESSAAFGDAVLPGVRLGADPKIVSLAT
jgi:hypothetical protein